MFIFYDLNNYHASVFPKICHCHIFYFFLFPSFNNPQIIQLNNLCFTSQITSFSFFLFFRWTPCLRHPLLLLQSTPVPLDPLCPWPLPFTLRPCPSPAQSSWRWGHGPLAPTLRMAVSPGCQRESPPASGHVSPAPALTWRASSGTRQRKVRSRRIYERICCSEQ